MELLISRVNASSFEYLIPLNQEVTFNTNDSFCLAHKLTSFKDTLGTLSPADAYVKLKVNPETRTSNGYNPVLSIKVNLFSEQLPVIFLTALTEGINGFG